MSSEKRMTDEQRKVLETFLYAETMGDVRGVPVVLFSEATAAALAELDSRRDEAVRAREERDESNRMARYAANQIEKIAAENARIREAAKPFAQCQLFEDRRSLGPNCCTGCALKHAMEIEA